MKTTLEEIRSERQSIDDRDFPYIIPTIQTTMNTLATETMNTTAPELALKVGYGWFSRSYKTNVKTTWVTVVRHLLLT